MIGTTLGHYKVTEQIGAGGMGVVYKALDLHLDRFVALKILPPEKVAEPERKRRFVQEAKAASALNHPNIVHVYDIDQTDGTDFIAMEYVDGKTLGELIPRKGMRLSDTLKYAVQIADALATAHAAGIVHRDLKPANVMVADKGLVKVLDFGLAKLTEPVESDEFRTTETLQPHTEEGTIVGTVAYMSPEQAEGKKVDARSDIFSLGSVLYEMVTGQRAFQGASKMSTLSAILHQEPKPVSGITHAVPADLEKLISRCLRKDPSKRFQHMDDVKVALDELKEDSDSGRLQAAPAGARQFAPVRFVILAVAVVAVVAAGWYWLSRQRPAEPEPTLTAVPLTSYPGVERAPSFSPDGTQVAFVWCKDSARQGCNIYIKQIDVEPPFRLTATPASDFSPAWSPDGATIAFLRFMPPDALSVVVVPQRGGPERVLTEFRSPQASGLVGYGEARYLAWTPDSKWLVSVAPSPNDPRHLALALLSLDTREQRNLTDPPPGVWGDIGPAVSPDGRTLVFSRDINNGTLADLYLLPLAAGYVAQGAPEKLPSNNPRNLSPAWTPDGREIVFASRTGSSGLGLWRTAVSERATSAKLPFGPNEAFAPAISRRLNRFVYAESKVDTNIWRIDLAAGGRQSAPVQLIASTQSDWTPTFSPDGKKIAYTSARSGTGEVWVCDSDGSNPVRLTSLGGPLPTGPRWSGDGQRIAFWVQATVPEGYIINVNGGVPRRLPAPPGGVKHPSWSRDGDWLYFCTKPLGIWKMSSDGGGAVQISGKGDMPQESPDGKFVYYSDGWPSPLTIWRIPVGGGVENKILDSVNPSTLWTIAPDGIYHFSVADDKGHSELRLYEFTTGKVRELLTIERSLSYGLSISPDGRTILYTQLDEVGSDLMLVENFR